jgi:DNA polymerase-3 subunit epsilon
MREIALDTETTGFEPAEGHRIVEIGAVELFNHLPTGRTFHQYFNPQRDMPREAFNVHGIGPDLLSPPEPAQPGAVLLKDKPLFRAHGQAFLDFIGDAKLVIHNAAFDMKFLNWELRQIGLPEIPWAQAIDTLAIAKQKFPGAPASLDALCRRFGVDNSKREKHGALLDSEILAEVYLELIGGRQPDFGLSSATASGSTGSDSPRGGRALQRATPLPPRLTADEEKTHSAFVSKIGDAAIWLKRV